MAKQDDGLFLIEALVDKVTFKKSPCFSDKDFRTCIKIECPSVEPLEICDDDPGSCVAKSGGPFTKSFNAGKSCLFSLSQADIGKAMSSFPIKVTAYKSLPCGCIPAVIVIGEATIDMTKEFVKARNQFLADPTNVSYEALQDKFRLLGTDKEDAGEVTMFLRISCFGKLIITKFQGAGGPPTLGTGGGSQVVDRSCSGPRAFQTPKDPCVCGASRDAAAHQKGASTSAPCSAPCRMGENKAVCPPAKDPYGSMPCEEDDPCYCSGPHPHKKQDMACKNTAEYCLHVPKGVLSRLRSMKEDQQSIFETSREKMTPILEAYYVNSTNNTSSSLSIEDFSTVNSLQNVTMSQETTFIDPDNIYSNLIMNFNPPPYVRYLSDTQPNIDRSIWSNLRPYRMSNQMFGAKETAVYVTLCDTFCHRRTSGTQATASVNKCLQVLPSSFNNYYGCCSNDNSTVQITHPRSMTSLPSSDGLRYPVVYWGRSSKSSGMGKDNKTSSSVQTNKKPVPKVQPKNNNEKPNKQGAATKKGSISEPQTNSQKVPCPGTLNGLQDMFATVSHIRIGPKLPCPISGTNPCKGPNCIQATKGSEQEGKVKVTSATNPRRGVFELVIRRMNGAPLARNELMVEWTPPPNPACPPCSQCRPVCGPPPKCPTIVCRAVACKPSSCWKKACGVPCKPCKPCKRCNKTTSAGNQCRFCCTPCPLPKRKPMSCSPCPPRPCPPSPCRPCRPCRPCPPKRCKPCPPKRCKPRKPCPMCRPCCPPPPRPCKPSPACCAPKCNPCGPCPLQPCCPVSGSCSAPCFQPCPVGYKKPRRCRSHSRPRSHRKKISPCLNRSKACGAPCSPCPPSNCCPPSSCCPPRKCRPTFCSSPRCSNLLCPPRPTDVEFVSPPSKRCC